MSEDSAEKANPNRNPIYPEKEAISFLRDIMQNEDQDQDSRIHAANDILYHVRSLNGDWRRTNLESISL